LKKKKKKERKEEKRRKEKKRKRRLTDVETLSKGAHVVRLERESVLDLLENALCSY